MTTSLSLTSSEQFRLVSLNVPELTDDGIKGQVQQSHKGNGYSKLLRQPHLGMIQKIIKPATVFIDSMLLENKVHENRTLLEFSNPLELNSALSELQQVGYPNFSHYTMEEIAIKAGERLDEINIHHLSMQVLDKFESGIPWDAKAVKVMGSFVIKFVEFLVFLLRGPDTPLSEFESIVVAFKENAVSLAGSQLEKFQNQIDQLNSVIKITLEVTENICDLSLLSDIEYNEDLLSMSVYWAILSVVACYIQIDLLKELGQLALDFSYLVSNLSNMLILLKNQKTICKPQLDEMEAYMMINAFFKETFSNIRKLKDNPTGISEIMKIFLSSKDARQLVIDGSTKSKVGLEVLNGKGIILFITDLDISTEQIDKVLKIYTEIREEDYYKIIWVPFVLKWTEELVHKFQTLISIMPWYIVCYDSPIAGLWYIKGLWFSGGQPSGVLVDPKSVIANPFAESGAIDKFYIHHQQWFPFKSLAVRLDDYDRVQRTTHPSLFKHYTDVNRNKKEGDKQIEPPNGFQGLLQKKKRGNK